MTDETPEDRAVTEAWVSLYEALAAYDNAAMGREERDTSTALTTARDAYDTAVEARTKARLAAAVPPMTMDSALEKAIRGRLPPAPALPPSDGALAGNHDRQALAIELDATRAALAAAQAELERAQEAAALDKDVMRASFEGLKERHAEDLRLALRALETAR